jgi:hypothetical protein
LLKATVSFLMFVRPSVRIEQLGSHWTDFHEILYLSIFRKFSWKIKVSLKSDKTKWYFYMKTKIYFWSYLANFFLEWKMFHTNFVEKIRTHILCSVTFFLHKLCRLWDHAEKYRRARQATDDNMAHAHCMLVAKGYKYTHRMCNTRCFSHSNNGCSNAPQCYVIFTLPLL